MPSAVSAASVAFAPTEPGLAGALALLERLGERSGSAVTADARRAAFARVLALPAPGTRPARGWRYDYDRLTFEDLRWGSDRIVVPAAPYTAPAERADDPDVDRPALATENAGGLVHAGSTLLEAPVLPNADPRITVRALADAVRGGEAALGGDAFAFARASAETDRFAALATAFQNCGAFVYVPPGVVVERPIQLVFASSEASDDAVFPHVYVLLGEGARATVIERHVGEGRPFVCGLVAVRAGAGAQLDYVAVQRSPEEARIVMQRTSRCDAEATVRWHVADLGGSLSRSTIDAQLDAPGARAEASVLFFNTGLQHVDLVTQTRHVVPNTSSDTVVRSAAVDRGQGRFVGNIAIERDAHGSDASLRDDVLLLSKHARIETVPALEIAANDVRAFHGATVGSLDEEALFYVGSRGIPRQEALRLVALGFFEPAISRFPGEALRDEIRTALDRKIDEATEFGT